MTKLFWFGMAVLLALAVISGCGARPPLNVNPRGGRPARDLATTPRVECVGDDVCAGLVAAAANPMWGCADCEPEATSGRALAALPLALAARPDVIIVLTGSYDVDDPGWTGPVCNADPDTQVDTCANIVRIIKQAQTAGVRCLYGTVPYWVPGTLSAELAPGYATYGLSTVTLIIAFLNHGLSDGELIGGSIPAPASFVDFNATLTPLLTPETIGPNGIDPSPAGYARLLAAVVPAIQKLNVGGTK